MNILGKNPFLTVTTDELDRNIAEATRRLESAKDRRKGQEDEQSRGKRVSEQGVLSGQTHRYAPR